MSTRCCLVLHAHGSEVIFCSSVVVDKTLIFRLDQRWCDMSICSVLPVFVDDLGIMLRIVCFHLLSDDLGIILRIVCYHLLSIKSSVVHPAVSVWTYDCPSLRSCIIRVAQAELPAKVILSRAYMTTVWNGKSFKGPGDAIQETESNFKHNKQIVLWEATTAFKCTREKKNAIRTPPDNTFHRQENEHKSRTSETVVNLYAIRQTISSSTREGSP